ncbi:sensor histidine kinase [Phenylobacterium deserti]|uniref:histidine kinase n=2 Tax=Phenylobacterium deserti TaxID=1914756 RepID=A0A328AUG3_9CAUL|nr:sensor histidine kinase [Phenylobacterium deserti]
MGWSVAVAGATLALTASGRLGQGPELTALTLGAAAGLVGGLLSAFTAGAARTLAILVWTFAAASACQLTGGVLGPLAAWALAPLAAAAAFRKADVLPLGAAASVGAAGLGVLGAVLGPKPVLDADAGAWLSLLSLATVALGLGAGLVSLAGVSRREGRERSDLEHQLIQLLESQPQLLLGVQPGGRILESFGHRPGGFERGLADGNLLDFITPADRTAVEEALQRALSEGDAETGFTPLGDLHGRCEITIRRASNLRLVAAIRDARAQFNRERDLEQARASAEQQNAGKSRFLANMSHELRTPLNAIMGFSDIMRQRLFGPMPDRYVEYAELIHESGAHLLELINDVLDMSKIEAERFELARDMFDARDAVSAVLRLMRGQADRAGVSLRGVLPPEALEADADRRAIKQIALNLISNALKFTPRGGAVTVTVQGVGEVLELIVTDTGVGISAEDLDRLGRPFEQAGDASQKAAGAGLGLSLVRAFAKLHGGEMTIESALGEGTTVLVRMPVLQAPPAPAFEPHPAPANDVKVKA